MCARPRAPGPRVHGWLALLGSLGLSGLSGCALDVPPRSYIHTTTLISIDLEVAALGPLFPERDAAMALGPFAEAMPGDQLRVSPVVVDPEGRRLDRGELSTKWFHCGVFQGCPDPLESDLMACGELERFDADATCILGTGDGEFVFEVPDISQLAASFGRSTVAGAIGWSGRSGDDCADAFSRGRPLDDCAFVQHTYAIGPEWILQIHAEEVGLVPSIPTTQIAGPALVQAPNRAPGFAEVEVRVGSERVVFDPDDPPPIAVRAGDELVVSILVDTTVQTEQIYYRVVQVPGEDDLFYFEPTVELIFGEAYTTGDLGLTSQATYGDHVFTIEVEQDADAGARSYAIVVLRDHRGAAEELWLAFDVVG